MKGHELNTLLELQPAVDCSWMMRCHADDDDDHDIDIVLCFLESLLLSVLVLLFCLVLVVVVLVVVVVVVVVVFFCQWFHVPNLESEDILDAKVLVRDVRGA